jgi:hypothetical protein
MHAKKAPTGDFPGRIGDEPYERRRHDLRLDHLRAIETRIIGHHGSVGDPAGDEDVPCDAGAIEVLRHDRGIMQQTHLIADSHEA